MRITLISVIIATLLTPCAWTAINDGSSAQSKGKPAEQLAQATASQNPGGASGTLTVNLTDIIKNPLDGRVELVAGNSVAATVTVTAGKGSGAVPAGQYLALVYAVEEGIPLMVHAQKISIDAGKATALTFSLLEGVGGQRLLRDFDRDVDLAIDRAEIEAGTNPEDPTSIPGRAKLQFPSPMLEKKGRWYRGELHAQSKYGQGTESVAELVKRAESLGLDFLAIADPNTLAAAQDPEFKSGSVALIPAMTWGDKDRGYALIYAPKTFPDPASTHTQAQVVARLVQAQNGVFAPAHPCFPEVNWRWYVPYVNAIQVWCRDWSSVPPITAQALPQELKDRTRTAKNASWGERGELIYSIAAAVNTSDLSANGQAALYWDYELVQGRKEAPIAGSMTGSPKVPMAQPVTYIYAEEKSVNGIIKGLREGRTYVSSGLEGPQLSFEADAMRDGKADVSMGGAVPIGLAVDLVAGVKNAMGKKMEILYNGLPIFSRRIQEENSVAKVPQKPEAYSVYRVRIVEPSGPTDRYGSVKVLAMSSPIYAEGILVVPPGMQASDIRFKLQGGKPTQSPYVAPVYATGVEGPDGQQRYHIEKGPERPLIPLGEDPLPDPTREKVIELKPTEF